MEIIFFAHIEGEIIPPIILASNWDQFGGRACAILVAQALSKKLNCDFKFLWEVDSRSPDMDDRINFFSLKFQNENRVFSVDPDTEVCFINPKLHTLEEARAIVASMKQDVVLKIEAFLIPPNFLDESVKIVLSELRNIALESMNSDLAKDFFLFENFNSNSVAIHGRFGDLLIGQFSQYVPLDKYVDTLTYRYYIDRRKNRKKLIFLTDTELVLEGLEILTNTKLGIDYKNDLCNNLQEHWADLFTLASSKSIVANYGSGFSVFASMLKGEPIDIIKSPAKNIFNYDLENHYDQFKSHIRNKLKSRDIINVLQKNFRVIQPSRTFELIEIAFKSDPDYVMASCFYSISQYLRGNKQFALQILINAEAQSRKVLSTHPDPLVLTLLVKYCLNSIEYSEVNRASLDELMNLVPYQIPYKKFLLFLSSWNDKSTKKYFQWPSRAYLIVSNIRYFLDRICSFIRFDYVSNQNNVLKNDDVDLLFSLLSLLKD